MLLDLLWPDRFKEQAQASLRQVIYEIHALGPKDKPLLVTSRDEVVLGQAIHTCDLWRFESRPGEFLGRRAEEMLDLYVGPFLSGPPLATAGWPFAAASSINLAMA